MGRDNQGVKEIINESVFKKVVECYAQERSVNKAAANANVAFTKARKVLITAGLWESELSREINVLYDSGLNASQIAEKIGITAKLVNNYLPYAKGIYNSDEPTKNAITIRRSLYGYHENVDFENVVTAYKRMKSVSATARSVSMSIYSVRKILISAGAWSSDRSRQIKELHDSGKNAPEIAEALNLALITVYGFLPISSLRISKQAPIIKTEE